MITNDNTFADSSVAKGKAALILTALSGICGQLALGLYYSGVMVPIQPVTADAGMGQLADLIVQHRVAIFWDAYLQGLGTLLTVIFFIRLVYLSRAGNLFPGWLVIITSSVMMAIALLDVTFTVATVNSALAKHPDTLRVAVDFITGSTEAFDYTFLFIPAPVLILSLGSVLLHSKLLPRVFAYLAIAIGIAFVALGIYSLFTTLSGSTGVIFEILQLIQTIWVLASAVFILLHRHKY